MPRILLHCCCGPCTLYPLQRLRADGWTVHGFFYNPNIQPYQEWQRRREALETVAEAQRLPLILRDDYDLEGFLRAVVYRESERCITCHALRLEAAARLAANSRFDAFTTTLLYSKLQRHDLARALAEAAGRRYGVRFFYQDFREGWRSGQEQARELGIYRQQYCGCIYSERDRFAAKPKGRRPSAAARRPNAGARAGAARVWSPAPGEEDQL